MNRFDELKQQAEAKVRADEAAIVTWAKAHKGWLAAVVVAFLLGLIIPHL